VEKNRIGSRVIIEKEATKRDVGLWIRKDLLW
jgi:hypothetical protein